MDSVTSKPLHHFKGIELAAGGGVRAGNGKPFFRIEETRWDGKPQEETKLPGSCSERNAGLRMEAHLL